MIDIDVKLIGRWKKTQQFFEDSPRIVKAALDESIQREGVFMRRMMVSGIEKQAPGGVPFKPLSPLTIALRRAKGITGTHALIETGSLLNSITVIDIRDGVFVGVPMSTRYRGGIQIAAIATIHEYGANRIPARPFVQPVADKHAKTANQRFERRIRASIGAAMGIGARVTRL